MNAMPGFGWLQDDQGEKHKKDNDMRKLFGKPDTGKVIFMDRFRTGNSLSPIRQAEAYWSALRTGAEVPMRSQIDPRGLENILEYAFIVERIAPGVARFRLAGQHLRDLAGMEVRGMPLTCFFSPAGRNRISVVLEHMFDAPSVAELTLTSEHKRGPKLEARMILMPLRSDMGTVNRALGVLIADGPMGIAPNRFDIDRTSLRAVSGEAQSEPENHPLAEPMRDPLVLSGPSDKSLEGFAEAQTPVTGKPVSKVPYLRVIK